MVRQIWIDVRASIYNDYFVDDDIINNNNNSNYDIINSILVDKIKVECKKNMKGAQEKNLLI